MQQALILDCETTGLIEPHPIEIATKGPFSFGRHLDEFPAPVVLRFKNAKPIEAGAMAIHRIIAPHLDGCPPWPGSWAPVAEYLIGHNIDSDWEAIGKPDVKRICTLALAKRVWDGVGSYKLAALIFHLYAPAAALELTEKAHEAETDIYLTGLLLDHILGELASKGIEPTSFEDLWHLSEEARIPLRIGFSKYGPKNGQAGTLYAEVPTGMLKWIVHPDRIKDMDPWEVKATVRELQRRGER
jgi:exodeoxyribonuclease X